MKDKAEQQLTAARKAEVMSKQNFELLKQSLEGQVAQDMKNKDEETVFKAETEETLATAKADIVTTSGALDDSSKALQSVQGECMQVAADHDTSAKNRAE